MPSTAKARRKTANTDGQWQRTGGDLDDACVGDRLHVPRQNLNRPPGTLPHLLRGLVAVLGVRLARVSRQRLDVSEGLVHDAEAVLG